jgi:hypothetical protein
VAGVIAITKIRRIVIFDWTSRPHHALLANAGCTPMALAAAGMELAIHWQLSLTQRKGCGGRDQLAQSF